MRIEYISPFVEGSYGVLQECLGGEIMRGKLSLKRTSSSIMGVAAIVGLAGQVEGRVIFDMNKDSALSIASIMNGEKLEEIDELVKGTIQELANMIAARAVTKLQESGYIFDITPPAILTGSNMTITDPTILETLIVPLEFDGGRLEINVAIKETKH